MEDMFFAASVPDTVESEGFVIDTDQRAEWALGKIKEHRAEAERIAAVCDAEIERYAQIKQEAIDKAAKDSGYLESLLFAYFGTVPHKATKTQETYKLPSGTLKQKARAPEYVRDDTELLDWLTEQGMESLIETKSAPKWAELKKGITAHGEQAVYTETGEVVPGVKVVEREPVFSVEV